MRHKINSRIEALKQRIEMSQHKKSEKLELANADYSLFNGQMSSIDKFILGHYDAKVLRHEEEIEFLNSLT